MAQTVYLQAESAYQLQWANIEKNIDHFRIQKIACMALITCFSAGIAVSAFFARYAIIIAPVAGLGITILFYLKVRKEFSEKFSKDLIAPCGKDGLLFIDVAARKAHKDIFKIWKDYSLSIKSSNYEVREVKKIFDGRSFLVTETKDLYNYCWEGFLGIFRAMYQTHSQDVQDISLLHLAAGYGQIEILKACVNEFHMPVDVAVSEISETDSLTEYTSLHVTAITGQIKAMDELIKLGANLHALARYQKDRLEAIQLAALYNQPRIIQYLVNQQGIDIHKTIPEGPRQWSALLWAINYYNYEAVQKILEFLSDESSFSSEVSFRKVMGPFIVYNLKYPSLLREDRFYVSRRIVPTHQRILDILSLLLQHRVTRNWVLASDFNNIDTRIVGAKFIQRMNEILLRYRPKEAT